MKPLAPNTMIQNRYLVVHLIGKGGMGDVYLAVDQRLGSAVALKRTFFADDEMLGNAFEREAKILARLRHPVLPKVSDHFLENSDQYLVMEHIAGDDLAKRLETTRKPYPVSWVMFWADQLLDALSYLHSHEPPIIHRDIKPQNLKLTDDNHIVLLDFGLSKESTGQTMVSKPGSSGSVVGYTPHFASMEQIRGTGTGPRSDIYSLSATLYQLITNTMPADALTRADAILNSKDDPIVPPSDLNPEVSPAVSNVILKGLAVSSEKRFANASDMQRALRTAHSQMNDLVNVETRITRGSNVHETVPPPVDPSAPLAPSEMATRVSTIPPERDAGASKNNPPDAPDTTAKASPAADAKSPKVTPTPEVETIVASVPAPVGAKAAAGSPGSDKKGSWLPLAMAGMFAVVLLGGAAVAGGWYYYRSTASTAAEIPAASPSPAAAATLEPALEAAAQPVQAETNTNTSPAATGEAAQGNAVATDKSSLTAEAAPSEPSAGRTNTTRAVKPPAVKVTPKPKPRNDRTVLLQ